MHTSRTHHAHIIAIGPQEALIAWANASDALLTRSPPARTRQPSGLSIFFTKP